MPRSESATIRARAASNSRSRTRSSTGASTLTRCSSCTELSPVRLCAALRLACLYSPIAARRLDELFVARGLPPPTQTSTVAESAFFGLVLMTGLLMPSSPALSRPHQAASPIAAANPVPTPTPSHRTFQIGGGFNTGYADGFESITQRAGGDSWMGITSLEDGATSADVMPLDLTFPASEAEVDSWLNSWMA